MKCGSEILWKETPSGSAEVITIVGFGRGRVELRSAVLQEGALLGGDPASCFRVGYGSQRAPFFPCSIPVCSQLRVWLRMNWVLGALQCSLRYRTRWPQPLLWERWCWSCRAVWAHGHTASSCREHGRGLAAGGGVQLALPPDLLSSCCCGAAVQGSVAALGCGRSCAPTLSSPVLLALCRGCGAAGTALCCAASGVSQCPGPGIPVPVLGCCCG